MIPQERVNERAEAENAYGYPRFKGERHEAFNEGFTAGVRFAESELKSVAMEFAEWREMRYHAVFNNPNKKYWYENQSFEPPLTTSELFAKFDAERQNP